MKITKVYQKGINNINEDAYTMNDTQNLYAVMDGATGLKGAPGYIASQAVQKVLSESSSFLLWERMKIANQNIRKAIIDYFMENTGEVVSFSNVQKTERSTTGIAAIQMDQEQAFFEYVHAGDCMIFMQYDDGDIRALTYDVVHYLDQKAVQEMQRLRKSEMKDLLLEQYVEKVKPLLVENRRKMNTNNGYSVLDGSDEAMQHLEYGKISLKRVRKILLMTDGLQMPVQENESGEWEKAAKIAFGQGVASLLEIVNKKERADRNGVVYPRLKTQDDKTAIMLEF